MTQQTFFQQEDDTPEYPNGDGPEETPEEPIDLTAILGAPDFASLISSKRESAISREYRKKTRSLLKAWLVGSLNTGNISDAAAILKHGEPFASAVGDLADQDKRARQALDIIMSPNNPWAMMVIAAIPLVTQVMRNHEPQLAEVGGRFKNRKARREELKNQPKPEPRFVIKLPFGRKIPIRLSVRIRFLSGLKAQTQDPRAITMEVFSDPKVTAALQRMGWVQQNAGDEKP